MKLRHLLALFILPVLTGVVSAQVTARIAVVDVDRIISESEPGKAATKKLQAVHATRAAAVKRLQDEVEQLNKQLNQLMQKNPSPSSSAISALQSKLQDKQTAAERAARDADQELGTLRDKELQALQARIKPVVDNYAKETGTVAILNKFQSGLVFAADSIDITDELIQRLNRAQP